MNNPGLCCIDATTRTISLFGFQNRLKETCAAVAPVSHPQSPFCGWTMRVHLMISRDALREAQTAAGHDESRSVEASNAEPSHVESPNAEPSSEQRMQRYLRHVSQLLGILCTLTHPEQRSRTRVAIEHYSFQSQNTRATSMLIELGTVLRLMLHHHQFQPREIAPTLVKRLFSGRGHAQKEDMYEAYRSRFYLPSLFELIGLTEADYKKIPHPIEDLVDALAVALAGYAP
jgi:Holliday junction resolvasome RuvABC endonuclease subunit